MKLIRIFFIIELSFHQYLLFETSIQSSRSVMIAADQTLPDGSSSLWSTVMQKSNKHPKNGYDLSVLRCIKNQIKSIKSNNLFQQQFKERISMVDDSRFYMSESGSQNLGFMSRSAIRDAICIIAIRMIRLS